MYKIFTIAILCLTFWGCGSDKEIKPNRVIPEVNINDQKYVDDPEVIGTWRAVDFVKTIKDFSPNKKSWKGKLIHNVFVFKKNGKTHKSFYTWTKGRVFHSGDKSEAKYMIKKMNDKLYLFMEHINGDVLFKGKSPSFYVFVKNESKK